MKVRLNTIMAGPDGSFAAGQVINVSDDEGKDLCARNFAVPVTDDGAETKVLDAPEKRTAKRTSAADEGEGEDEV